MTPNQEPVEREWNEIFGFNDRGIVTYSSGMAITGYKTPTACCNNCGEMVKGKKAKEWMFGHIGCKKSGRYYIKNTVTPEILSDFISHQKALSRVEVLEEVRRKIEKLPDKQNDEFGEITISYSDTLVVVDEMKGDL